MSHHSRKSAGSQRTSGAMIPELTLQPPEPHWSRRRAQDYEVSEATEAPLAEAAEDEEEESSGLAGPILRSIPPWLISAAFHMTLLLILALIWLVHPTRNQEAILTLSDVADAPSDLNTTGEVQFDLNLPRDELALIQDLPQVPDPFAQPNPPVLDIPSPVAVSPSSTIAVALRGREEGARQSLLEKYGGTQESEEAVRKALIWLARQQKGDGSWSLRGPYTMGAGGDDLFPAATALALIAFQGNGNTHKRGQYQKEVAKGIAWLIRNQDESGRFPVASAHDTFYTQGLCTIALCELYGMSSDSDLRAPAEKAVEFCVRTQAFSGGWRYGVVDGRSMSTDLSVTGWVVMALQSARMAGLDVPADTLGNVTRFLDENSADFNGRRYSYLLGNNATAPMTAEGLLCRQYLGWAQDDERLQDGVAYLVSPENLPSWERGRRNVYGWYYATQVTHHMEGKAWLTWNGVMRDLLVNHQTRTGREAGSWEPDGDFWANDGGRLYVTCLSVYILEVYYRHLPLYADVKLPRK